MKRFTLFVISLYQIFISPIIKQIGITSQCRYSPSCSEYAKIVIGKYGVVKGTAIAMHRLLSCQPFGKTPNS